MIANYTNHAANERTFLAWTRTGLAMATFGFFVTKLTLLLDAMTGAFPPDRRTYGANVIAAAADLHPTSIPDGKILPWIPKP